MLTLQASPARFPLSKGELRVASVPSPLHPSSLCSAKREWFDLAFGDRSALSETDRPCPMDLSDDYSQALSIGRGHDPGRFVGPVAYTIGPRPYVPVARPAEPHQTSVYPIRLSRSLARLIHRPSFSLVPRGGGSLLIDYHKPKKRPVKPANQAIPPKYVAICIHENHMVAVL